MSTDPECPKVSLGCVSVAHNAQSHYGRNRKKKLNAQNAEI